MDPKAPAAIESATAFDDPAYTRNPSGAASMICALRAGFPPESFMPTTLSRAATSATVSMDGS